APAATARRDIAACRPMYGAGRGGSTPITAPTSSPTRQPPATSAPSTSTPSCSKRPICGPRRRARAGTGYSSISGRAILSGPEAPPPSAGPTFDEPWQAQLLALADTLTRGGAFTPTAWSDALGAALRRAAAEGAPDTVATYYEAVLEALEGLLTR